jgi:hypothetical protein
MLVSVTSVAPAIPTKLSDLHVLLAVAQAGNMAKEPARSTRHARAARYGIPLVRSLFMSTPMRRVRSCPRATSGHATAALPSNVMKSRRVVIR